MIKKPPPLLGDTRVLEYAIIDESVTYSGDSPLFVATVSEGLKELGPVPCLAITQDLKTTEIRLLYCDQEWDLLGLGGRYQSVEQAKARAQRSYHGVSSRWIDAKITEEEASKFRNEVWSDNRCSFCERIPPDADMMIERKGARICDSCIEEFQKMLQEQRASKAVKNPCRLVRAVLARRPRLAPSRPSGRWPAGRGTYSGQSGTTRPDRGV